jgi:hypothetical protein
MLIQKHESNDKSNNLLDYKTAIEKYKKNIEKMDTEKARQIYSERMGIVEPVFANIRYNKNMNRFTLPLPLT